MRKTTLRGVWLSFIWGGLLGICVGLYLHLPVAFYIPMLICVLVGVAFWEPRCSTIKCLRRLLGITSQQGDVV